MRIRYVNAYCGLLHHRSRRDRTIRTRGGTRRQMGNGTRHLRKRPLRRHPRAQTPLCSTSKSTPATRSLARLRNTTTHCADLRIPFCRSDSGMVDAKVVTFVTNASQSLPRGRGGGTRDRHAGHLDRNTW